MQIVYAAEADLPAIRRIWNHYIETTTYNWRPQPFSAQDIAAWFAAHTHPGHPVLVAKEEDRVLGFAALSAFREAAAYWPCAEDTIYLEPLACGRGVGRALMQRLCELGKAGGVEQVISMIDGSNAKSVAFHEKLGFCMVGTLRAIGEKNGMRCDCVVLQKTL